LLTSQAEAQNIAPGNRPPAFDPNPAAPRPDAKKDQHGSASPLTPLLQYRAYGTAPGSLPENFYMKPIPAESFSPHIPDFKVPSSLPEISASHFAVPRESWFRSVAGHGAPLGIGGGIAALFGALFGRKKNTDS
jgi:hypothetical protein